MSSQEVTLRQTQDPAQAAEELVWATPTTQHLGRVYKVSYVASLRRILLLIHIETSRFKCVLVDI